MNASELRILAGLAEGRTLSQIAADLSLGEPAVSKALRHIEQRTGLQLVDHAGYRLVLTPTGRDVTGAARELAKHLRRFDDLLDQVQRGQAGCLRVISTNTPGTHVLPSVVAEFVQRFQRARVEIDLASPDRLWRAFGGGQHDLAVGPVDADGRPVNQADWSATPLYEDRVVFFAPADSALASKSSLSWDDIAEQTILDPFSHAFWMRQPRVGGIEARNRLEVRGIEQIKGLVAAGAGVGMLMAMDVADDIAASRFVALNVKCDFDPLPYYLVRRNNESPPPLVGAFASLLYERVAQPPQSGKSRGRVRPGLV